MVRVLKNQNEIRKIIESEDEIKAIQLIMGDNKKEVSMVISTTFFSTLYIIPYELKQFVYDELWDSKTKLFLFSDVELTEAWKSSYLLGGISEDRWDRRTIFHPYNEMNEMFSMSEFLLEEILGISRHQDHIPKWKVGMVEWYRKKLLN